MRDSGLERVISIDSRDSSISRAKSSVSEDSAIEGEACGASTGHTDSMGASKTVCIRGRIAVTKVGTFRSFGLVTVSDVIGRFLLGNRESDSPRKQKTKS